jgi:hypothetical protein
VKKKTSIDLFEYSNKWINKIINIIAPKYILCEGKTTYNYLMSIYEEMINKKYIGKNSGKETWNHSILNNGIKVFGYHRVYSKILQRDRVALRIQRRLNQ